MGWREKRRGGRKKEIERERKKEGTLPVPLCFKFILVAIGHAMWYEQVGLQIIPRSERTGAICLSAPLIQMLEFLAAHHLLKSPPHRPHSHF